MVNFFKAIAICKYQGGEKKRKEKVKRGRKKKQLEAMTDEKMKLMAYTKLGSRLDGFDIKYTKV